MSLTTVHLSHRLGLAVFRPGAAAILSPNEMRALGPAQPNRHAVIARMGFGGGGRR